MMRIAVLAAVSAALLHAGPTPEYEALKESFCDPAQGWKALFNGKDLNGWHPQDYTPRPQKPFDWRVGVVVEVNPADDHRMIGKPAGPTDTPALLTNREGKTANLVTDETFADVELYVEYAMPRKTNSGVALMGNYEIQLYDSYGKPAEELKYGDNGGIYAFKGLRGRVGGRPPTRNVSRPPGEWQSLHVWFQAPRFGKDGKKIENARFLKIVLNGVELHPDYELIKSTRAIPPWPEKPEAPLLLQGDHGPVAFRNIYIRELRD